MVIEFSDVKIMILPFYEAFIITNGKRIKNNMLHGG
jgi:hypothetical protein